MPWCEDCNRYFNPPSMGQHGECPSCGKVIASPRPAAPWHFKMLLLGVVVYLGYRLYQGIFWLAHHL